MAAPQDRSRRISSLFSLSGDSGSFEPKLIIPPTRARSPAGRLLKTARSMSPSQLLSNHSADFAKPRYLSADHADASPMSPASATLSVPAPTPVSATPVSATPSSNSDRRRSWRPGTRASPLVGQMSGPRLDFWTNLKDGKLPYDPTALLRGDKVSDVWNEHGDTFVYIFPRESGKGPSFRIDSSAFASSSYLTFLAHGGYTHGRQSSLADATSQLFLDVPSQPEAIRRTVVDDASRTSPPGTPPTESSEGDLQHTTSFPEFDAPISVIHLYLPVNVGSIQNGNSNGSMLSNEDIHKIITIRNLFAFLSKKPLVATFLQPTLFHVFLAISDVLKEFKFSNLDGSSLGEVPSSNFDAFVEQERLADVRQAKEKNIEALVLGERMQCLSLYNEAFVHGVGRWEEMKAMESPIFDLISRTTRSRMERASYDLDRRLKSVHARLTDFEFPSLFSGFANSTSLEEAKTVHFKAWKQAFLAFRRYLISYYKEQYGSWPPKSGNKHFKTDGLNRIVLQLLYRDLSDLYDMMVDRTSLTTRTLDGPSDADAEGESSADPLEASPRALRRIMSEYDRSSPPVQPPIPFDTPKLPSLPNTDSKLGFADHKQAARRLRDDEIDVILSASYNRDSAKRTLFLERFRSFERKSAHGKTVMELCDQRNGYWIFLYAVLQSLPMVVIDAPDLRWHQGVEYFLCQPPKGGVPWSHQDSARRKSWYGIAGGSGVVSLPSDVVDYGVEGIYRRSHCWKKAEQWSDEAERNGIQLGGAVEAPIGQYGYDKQLPDPPAPYAPPVAIVQGPNGVSGPLSIDGSLKDLPGAEPDSLSPVGRPRRQSYRKSIIDLGLESLPVPSGIDPVALRHPTAPRHNPTKSFEDILGPAQPEPLKRR
ncbi:MAG: hypothetical protein M1825_004598 [Sarcosagium campestre]|nr:MAG: hypothetical protein M1825_004598 [Sarcosagium campestre]